ncbi:hypothetical protein CEUSTIGMA_g12319.t1 [Chlamydomonas eustigma]|uniref:Strawberry notch AAA domain-containing protein n=1 Tax=Chlamydomonas eustigma TaxID=1157962 RepID=A0A250XPB5_9CHLO|nr:hypothetical protein CEUSTIGMA_g12319.t1 [Chlamydomonas eustigma]|eukprot:GAX84898.1 hypothetical protein CEUSTIGMA_g12319.t1 [Chlamydomonas eustigma]
MDDDGDLEGGEATTKNVFSNYFCSVKKGSSHPGDIAEAASLGAVKLPYTSYPLWDALPEDLVGSGKLSCLQLEGILHACTMHQKLLPGTGERAGFFIGDGAGVGKGRQIAGTIIDNYVRGRRKHVWVSISTDLHLDATRDFRDLGCHINIINNCQSLDKETRTFGLSKDYQEGVLFMTYSTLTSCSKGRSRIEQVIDWVGGASWSGVLVFDECHKAKNFAKDTGGTKMAAAVIELQQRLPQARVLYCSATGVSEVGNMAYMSRMGLWGPGTAFQDFEAFLDSMKKRGVSFMELLAMEMKAEGKYVARGLSFKDAEFMEVEAPLEKGQAAIYDDAVKLWKQLRRRLEYAEPMMPPVSSSTTAPSSAAGGGVSAGTAGTAAGGASSGGSSSKDVWRAYWAVQQRFFKLLCVSMKVLLVVSEAKEALAKGQSVVIGLQSTGEAAADAMNLSPGEVLPAFVSPTKEMLHRFVHVHFPTVVHHVEDGNPDLDGGDSSVAGSREVPELVQMKEELHEAIEAMQLPPNFLDHIIDELGGPAQVAEMTGRKGRVIRGSRGKLTYELRARPETADMDSLNVRERDAFMSGRKLVAIISDAASTGISLHASHTVKNQRRRIHMTVELPWSADKAIQQLGRTHRSNQVTGPIYKLISTRVGGEKRFAAAVARRLQSMGALTRGDRRAASGVDLSASNMDTPLGRKSLRRMYDAIVLESESLPPGVKMEDVYCDHPDAELFKCDDVSLTARHIARLHVQLREYCDLMGVGLSTNGKSKDTVVDDSSSRGRKSGGDGES